MTAFGQLGRTLEKNNPDLFQGRPANSWRDWVKRRKTSARIFGVPCGISRSQLRIFQDCARFVGMREN